MRDQAEQMITVRIRRLLAPDFVQAQDAFPAQCETVLQCLDAFVELFAHQRMIEDGPAESDALPREIRRFRQGPLRDGHAAQRIGGAREVQHLQD